MQMTATVRATLDETRILVSDETGDRLLARFEEDPGSASLAADIERIDSCYGRGDLGAVLKAPAPAVPIINASPVSPR